ncbi:hypothetical protein, partial [Streptomyces sp. NPDC059802]|uniref:hypothetical protein n=1 Tax=Streptomyces sp. NPDC059802 TaxID=3346952 RepID=UPI00365EA16D
SRRTVDAAPPRHPPPHPRPVLNARRRPPGRPDPAPAPPPSAVWCQLALFEARRDLTGRRASDEDARRGNPWLAWARHSAHRLGEARGWPRKTRLNVDQALVIVLTGHAEGDAVRYSEVFPVLRSRGLSVERTTEVLDHIGVFLDDRPSSFELWLESKLNGLATGIAHDVGDWAKKNGTIFKNPTSRIRVGQREEGVIQPLEPEHINGSIAAVTYPADRLILALAAVHAARPAAIRRLQLDDLDIGNRRLSVDGRTRRLDELTLQVAREWLEFRRRRRPDTANPHLLINKHTALGTGPIGKSSVAGPALHRQTAALERLRMDRQLEEALAHGPDPLHLAEVFGLSEKTAIRYANSARALLEQAAEHSTSHSGKELGPACGALKNDGHADSTGMA